MPLTGWWATVLAACRDEAGLAAAWALAAVPGAVVAFADNVHRIAAAGAADGLWLPKVRATISRVLLWTAVLGPALSLPVSTIVYVLTGVRK
ncbi:hypothetical protein [Streptomyces sp. NPDC101149]|uniref:hypothetical protein n=1 Tax=Streptomyces sp. NPDC101149 TaxID=3366113 RepID=UPI00382D6A79